ncbi:hypothetical protein AB0L10_44780 [Streptomyces flaveolus]|uniref:hypothetical protein n=1 Tax=Streptomyces flaveolus TaxID=67297 RepID=UPI003435C49C
MIRAVRGLVHARRAVYVYDYGMVGTARRRVRTIRWDQVSQVVVFAKEGGLHIAADGRPMIVRPRWSAEERRTGRSS